VEQGDANAIQLLLPRRWGVVCSQVGTTITTVVFPNLPSQPLPTGADAGILLRNAAGAWVPALPARATVATATPVVVTAACASLSTSGDLVAYQLTGVNHQAVPVGSTVALYQRVRYDVETSPRGEQWIYRSNGMAGGAFDMQPLAGPVDAAAGGISFTYYTGTPPTALLNPPGANAPTSALSQVRLRVRMKSRSGGTATQVEFDSATVQLRNDN
jgi:hypothetical protein